jgi:acetyltransferase
MTVPRLNPAGRFDPAALFHPASIAIIGAETEAGSQIMANLAMGGFKGPIHTRITENTSLAILAEPPDLIGAAMTALARANCFAAIVPGPADDLAAHAARTGVRVLGANSFGLAVPRLNLNATRSHIQPPPGRLALICQSAALSRTIIDWAEPNGVGFSHIVGLGTNADIGFGITLDWLSRDPGTGAILLGIRHIKNHRVFLSAARAAAKLRPVVAIRPGLRLLDDNEGDSDGAFEAALRRAGVLYVKRLEDLLTAAETLSRARPARFDTLAIVSNAIDPGRLAADAVLRHGLNLVTDVLHAGSTNLAATAFKFAARPDIGGVLVVHTPSGPDDEAAIAALTVAHKDLHAPLLVCAMGETTGALHRSTLARAGLPVFATPDQAVRGFEHLVRDHHNRQAARELPPSTVLAMAPEKDRVRRSFDQARASGHLTLAQDQALDILSAYGIPFVPTRVAASAQDAADAAGFLGYPAVVKQRDDAAPADRPPGGVICGLHDAAQVTAAAKLLRTQRPGELLVQRYVSRSREVAVRVTDHSTFGPIIIFGCGGTTPNPTDRAIDLPPLNLALAHGLIQRCRTGAMLGRPLRDCPPASIDVVAQTLVRISQLIVDFPEIAELDIPSLFVDSAGVLAADAWLRLRAPNEPPARLAITPYPIELTEHRQVGPDRMTIRPIRPEDAAAHTAFFARISPQDIRYRFFSAMRELSAEQTARLTQIDYDREMAFIAVNETTGDTVAVARLACDSDGRSGEFAIIVQADMKGRGLASHLLQRLIAWARTRGLTEVVGQILSDNHPMLAFIRHMGFTVRRMADDPEVMEAKLLLQPSAPEAAPQPRPPPG